MGQFFTATVEDGVLKPDQPLNLPAGARVKLSLERLPLEQITDDEAWEELERLMDEMSVDTGGVRMTRDQLHERR